MERMLARRDGPLYLALALTVAGLLEAPLHAGGEATANVMWLSAVATLPIALLRRRPALAGAITSLAVFITLAGQLPLTLVALFAQLLVAFVVATRHRRYVSALLDVPLVVLLGAVGELGMAPAFLLALVVAAQVVGDTRRQRRVALAERDAAVEDQAALSERARIARELHDVVAHHVSMVAVQAETARLTTPGMPAEGQERLAAIGETARDAMAEMRRLLGVLRADAAAELAPQPGLARLADLIETARTAGTDVRLTLIGKAVALPPGVDLTAYRIVQEALSNARRHAATAAVDVALEYGRAELSIRVRDRGPGPGPGQRDGHGLLGMRERVAMVGGELRTGAAPGGGFLVSAEIPL